MAGVVDVAEYILQKQGSMTAMKLQKLCYYSQAWHMVWEETPLFDEDFQAWANGPVARPLYSSHWRQYMVEHVSGDPAVLKPNERESVDVVLNSYGSMSGMELSHLTHNEAPWQDARAGLPAGAPSEAVIPKSAIAEYYEGVLASAKS